MGRIVNDGAIILCMFKHLALISTIALTLVLPAASQGSGNVIIDSDLRLFITMAALNAAGFDVELGSQYHPVREAARKLAANLDSDLTDRLKLFYRTHKGDQADEDQLAKYVSLAVSLTDPPGLKPATREEVMPPDARSVLGFVPLMREFYQQARVTQNWTELRPQYGEAISRIGPALREVIVGTDAYLRIPLGGPAHRSLAIYVEMAAPINSVNVRSYQDDYFVVLGPPTNPHVDDVRHAYLHFHLDSLVARNVSKIENGSSLLALVAKAEGVQAEYTSDFHIMATESLIRAVELRMDRTPAVPARESIDMSYRSGLLLTPYFFEALEIYEQREAGIRESFGEMASRVQITHEQMRFQERFHKIPVPKRNAVRAEVPETVAAPPPNPIRDLLKQAEGAFNSNDLEKARLAFEKVLFDYDRTNGAAFYGLALIASRADDSEVARQYFERTIRSDSAEPSMRVWAYIFMARILDLECQRERALEYYQQAIKVGDDTRNAQAVAREGMKKPYGDACR